MLRPLFVLAVVSLVGLFLLRFVLGLASIAGFLFGLLLKVAIVAVVIYFVLRVVSPDTARKMKEHWTGPTP